MARCLSTLPTTLIALVSVLLTAPRSASIQPDTQPISPNEVGSVPLRHFHDRPDPKGTPSTIRAAMWVVDVDKIESANQKFFANIVMLATWNDPRLAHRDSSPRTFDLDDVWNPRLLVANETSSSMTRQTLPKVVNVEPDGTVTYRQRYIGAFSQPLHLNEFPFDQHEFNFHILALGYDSDELEFLPDEEWVGRGLARAAGISDRLSIPDWTITGVTAGPRAFETVPGSARPGYALVFTAQRNSFYFIVRLVVPLLFIIMMSWAVFWIDPNQSGPQISLSVTTMLTVIAFQFVIDKSVPPVSYMTRLDWLVQLSTVLVLLALFVVIYKSRLVLHERVDAARAVDRVCRIAFPLAYIAVVTFALVA